MKKTILFIIIFIIVALLAITAILIYNHCVDEVPRWPVWQVRI